MICLLVQTHYSQGVRQLIALILDSYEKIDGKSGYVGIHIKRFLYPFLKQGGYDISSPSQARKIIQKLQAKEKIYVAWRLWESAPSWEIAVRLKKQNGTKN